MLAGTKPRTAAAAARICKCAFRECARLTRPIAMRVADVSALARIGFDDGVTAFDKEGALTQVARQTIVFVQMTAGADRALHEATSGFCSSSGAAQLVGDGFHTR